MRKFHFPTIEYLDKCPCCHKENVNMIETTGGYGIAKIREDGKLDTEHFLPLATRKCSYCGAVYFFQGK